MQKIYSYLKGEKVLLIALAAAVLSMFFVRPDAAYAGYVDWDVLMLLFALMAVVAGLKRCGLMSRICHALTRRAGSVRSWAWQVCFLGMVCLFKTPLSGHGLY